VEVMFQLLPKWFKRMIFSRHVHRPRVKRYILVARIECPHSHDDICDVARIDVVDIDKLLNCFGNGFAANEVGMDNNT